MTDLIQMKLSLPPELAAYVHEQAARNDRTPSGQIRAWISERRRREPPPEGAPVFPDALAPAVPGVKPDGRSIAEAKVRLGELEAERDRIKQKQRRWSDTAADGARLDRLNAEVELFRKNIATAQRMMPSNGGQNAV
jgi:hypothetical protein